MSPHSTAAPKFTNKTYSTHCKKFSGDLADYASWYPPHEQPMMTDAEFLGADDPTASEIPEEPRVGGACRSH